MIRVFHPSWLLLLLVCLQAGVLCPGISAAGELKLLGDLEYFHLTGDSENRSTGEETMTENTRFSQLYSLDLQTQVFPNLTLLAGGLFEHNDSELESAESLLETTDRTIRPYLEMELNNPLYLARFAYRDTETRQTTTGFQTIRRFIEEVNGRVMWRPAGLPTISLDYLHTTVSDDPLTKDTENTTWLLDSRYTHKNWRFDYLFTRNETEEKIADRSDLSHTHNGRVQVGKLLRQGKLSLNASTRVERTTAEFSGTGQLLRTTPEGRRFLLIGDPAPSQNLDGAFTFAEAATPLSSVNIGRGGGLAPVSIGLDFGQDTASGQLRILLVSDEQDSLLATPSQIAGVANLFSWRVFVSDDQLDWNELGVTDSTYDTFLNQFEISYAPAAGQRYLKVVVTPLNMVAPGEIRIADLQAFFQLPADVSELTTTALTTDGSIGYQLSARTRIGYDASLYYREDDLSGGDSGTVVNGIHLRHVFNPTFTGSTRLLRTDTWEHERADTTSYNFNASLSGNYLPTLTQTLAYTFLHVRDPGEGDSTGHTIFLRTNAKMHPGWDISLDNGYSLSQEDEGDRTSLFARVFSTIHPHRKFNLNLDYSIALNTETGKEDTTVQDGSVNAFYLPFETLSLSANYFFRKRSDEENSYVQRIYSANWAPFRGGDLQFSFTYSEASDTEDRWSRSWGPDIRWRISPSFLLSTRYLWGESETATDVSETELFLVNFRFYY